MTYKEKLKQTIGSGAIWKDDNKYVFNDFCLCGVNGFIFYFFKGTANEASFDDDYKGEEMSKYTLNKIRFSNIKGAWRKCLNILMQINLKNTY